MKTFNFLVVLIFISLLGFQCEDMLDSNWGTRFVNNSDKPVYFTVSFESINGKLVPSTKWPDESWKRLFVPAHQENVFLLRWDSVNRDADSVAVFVFDPDILEKYTWEEIRKDRNCLKIYKMKYKDLPVGVGALNYP